MTVIQEGNVPVEEPTEELGETTPPHGDRDASPAQLVAVLRAGGGPARVLGADEPLVYADDLGLTRGDGCFDATLVCAVDPAGGPRRILHLDRHLARLARSAAALDLECPPEPEWRALVEQAVGHPLAPAGQAMLKLVLTRGREVHGGGVLAYLTVTALPEATLALRAHGVEAVTISRGMTSDAYADVPWLLGGVKTISYAMNMAAYREAARRGVSDAVFVSTDGFILEGPTSALVMRNGQWLTTTPVGATGVLASITADTMFEAAKADGFTVMHRLMRPDQVYSADGVWLVSSVRGVIPVRRLDGRELSVNAEMTGRLARLAGFPG